MIALLAVSLAAVILALVWRCLRTRSLPSAVSLSIGCAAWLLANNNRFEGPVLISIDDQHGLTTADLFAVAGATVAVLSQLIGAVMTSAPVTGAQRTGWARFARAAAAAFPFLVGLMISYLNQPG